jgi:hypothetical protein
MSWHLRRGSTESTTTPTLRNYVLAAAISTAIPEATTIMVKILLVQWTWTMRLNSYTKIRPRISGKRG